MSTEEKKVQLKHLISSLNSNVMEANKICENLTDEEIRHDPELEHYCKKVNNLYHDVVLESNNNNSNICEFISENL